jgi:hypothetical protein
MNPIYTITTLRGTIHEGIRCVGFAHDLKDAIEWVEDNAMDINECDYYWYVVIEKVNPGIYNFELDHVWFKWNRAEQKYKRLDDTPDQFKRVCAFGIG